MFQRALMTLVLVLAAQSAARALPILSEVLYDAEGSDAPLAFTEIYGSPGTSLEGWALVGINGSSGSPYRTVDLTGALIPEDGVLVVATDRAEGDLLLARDFVGNVDWQNGPDAVALWNALGETVDALQYGELSGPSLGEGAAAPEAPAGLALARDPWLTDTDDNLSDFAVLAPTPGRLGDRPPEPEPPPGPEPGPVSVPEPAAWSLLACGLLALGGRGAISTPDRREGSGRWDRPRPS